MNTVCLYIDEKGMMKAFIPSESDQLEIRSDMKCSDRIYSHVPIVDFSIAKTEMTRVYDLEHVFEVQRGGDLEE